MDMDQTTFTSLLKDLLSRLYDPAALETHPLALRFPLPANSHQTRGAFLQDILHQEIEALRPPENILQPQASEARAYLILRKRYIEGLDPHQVAAALFIGDRQFRRDHNRALQALSARLWQRYLEIEDADVPPETFEAHPQTLNLEEVLQGLKNLTALRLQAENVRLTLALPPLSPRVFADRVLLRQALLSLLNYALHLRAGPDLRLDWKAQELLLGFDTHAHWQSAQAEESDSLEFARRLCDQMNISLRLNLPAEGKSGRVEVRLRFAPLSSPLALVIDDHPAALKMFQRYLSLTNLQVIGLDDASLALETALRLKPALILLDVMMPRLDGWEVLQMLKLNEQTRSIPVLVCSAWGDAELAHSLGASAFLKKPITQKELLSMLNTLDVLG